MGPGLTTERNGSPDMYIYDCFSETCQNAYSMLLGNIYNLILNPPLLFNFRQVIQHGS